MIIATKRKIINITWTAEQAAGAEVRLFNTLIAFFYKKGITPDRMKLKIDRICGCIEAETDCHANAAALARNDAETGEASMNGGLK